MRLINPSFEIYEQGPGLEGIYEAIERAGRTCYKSTRPEGQTAKDFVNRMIASQHFAMLEHGTVYLKMPVSLTPRAIEKYISNPYSVVNQRKTSVNRGIGDYYITTNYRVLVENDWLSDLKYLCEPTEFHEKRVTVRFTTDIGVSREFNRHRVNSMAEQSTRYCNYAKDKFNNELSVVLPKEFEGVDIGRELNCCALVDYCGDPLQGLCTMISTDNTSDFTAIDYWLFATLACEYSYMNLIRLGWKPQQARRILPLDLVTELVHTAFVSDWNHFFDLRARGTTGAPHPDAKNLAEPLMEAFYKRNLIN